MKEKRAKQTDPLLEALRLLLKGRKASTQESICAYLEKQGFKVNQSKISRMLRKIGAIKAINSQGAITYSLSREPVPPVASTSVSDLIIDVIANEMLVVIFTSPGSASLVARMLDYNQMTTEILATIAGDDTIFVAPKSVKNIHKLYDEIRSLLKR